MIENNDHNLLNVAAQYENKIFDWVAGKVYVGKGLSTTEGERGHVTTYTYCVTIKIQMLKPDILKIVRVKHT